MALRVDTQPGLDRPSGFPGFLDSRHMKLVRLSALRTGRLYSLRKIHSALLIFVSLSWSQSHCADVCINWMKNLKNPTWHQTSNIPVCSAVSQPTAYRAEPRRDMLHRISPRSIINMDSMSSNSFTALREGWLSLARCTLTCACSTTLYKELMYGIHNSSRNSFNSWY